MQSIGDGVNFGNDRYRIYGSLLYDSIPCLPFNHNIIPRAFVIKVIQNMYDLMWNNAFAFPQNGFIPLVCTIIVNVTTWHNFLILIIVNWTYEPHVTWVLWEFCSMVINHCNNMNPGLVDILLGHYKECVTINIIENQLLSIFYIMKLHHDLKFNHTYIFSHFIIRDGNWQLLIISILSDVWHQTYFSQ